MKTTEKISLGGFAFVVESDAYEALESYLSEIRECFRNDNSADEIVEDIEVRIAEILKEKYPSAECALQYDGDPWKLLVMGRLSAQCTDARVNLITPALFAEADTPEAMAQMPVSRVRELIATCGMCDTKAQRLVEMSRLLLERHGGQVPGSFEELEALPGVGHKTASVVMNQAFGSPAFPVDTHIFRLARLAGIVAQRTNANIHGRIGQHTGKFLRG